MVKFKDNFNSDTLFITKMGRTLLPKFPRDQDERLWKYIRVLLLGPSDDSDIDDPLLIRPPQQSTASLNNTSNSSPVSLSSMTLNGGSSSAGVNGNNTMATAGVIGPRHMNNKNSPLNVALTSGRNKVKYFEGHLSQFTNFFAKTNLEISCLQLHNHHL